MDQTTSVDVIEGPTHLNPDHYRLRNGEPAPPVKYAAERPSRDRIHRGEHDAMPGNIGDPPLAHHSQIAMVHRHHRRHDFCALIRKLLLGFGLLADQPQGVHPEGEKSAGCRIRRLLTGLIGGGYIASAE